MPASYRPDCYQARVNVAIVRLYQSSDDLMPNGKFIERGEIVQTDRAAVLYDESTRLRIREPEDYAGLWIDASVCDLMPVTIKEEVTKKNTSVSIYVTSNNPIIYVTKDSQTPITSKLETGSVLTCDDRVETVSNGIAETRYHIAEVSVGSDQSVVGSWILSNSKINDPVTKKVIPMKSKAIPAPLDLTAPVVPPNRRRMQAPTFGNQVVIDVNAVDALGRPIWETSSQGTRGDVTNKSDMTAEEISNISASQAISNKGNYEVKVDQPSSSDYTDPTATNTANPAGTAIDAEIMVERAMNAVDFAGQIYDWNNKDSDDADGEDYSYYQYNYAYDATTLGGIKISRVGYVHGIPFQYTALTDRRINSASICGEEDETSDMYGRTFAQEIISNTPIVVFAPGEPKFLSAIQEGLFGKFFDSKQGEVRSSLKTIYGLDTMDDERTSLVEELLSSGNEQYDYFTMEINTAEYYKYVNSMCRLLAKNMGLSSRAITLGSGSKTCDLIDWGNYNVDVDRDSAFDEILGLDGGVSFAFDAQSSVSDSLNTSTGDSELAGLLNQSSSKVREINFVMGAAAGKSFLNGTTADFANSNGVDGVLGRLGSLVNNTISGMNVRFPEIWQDTSSSKDYSLDMRFIAPYATPFCIWRYVLVPFIHILALAAPRSTQRVNSYVSPFLIRAFSKGYFNVEMGMITGITWKRFGDGDMISADGLPTQIDVTVDFKDLYHTLTISPWKTTNLGLFFNNTGLIDLLGTLSGVNMNRISLTDRLSLYGFALKESVTDIGTNFMRHVNDRVRNVFDNFFMQV